MALNGLGLGFVITARDAASAVFRSVGGAMGDLAGKAGASRSSLNAVGTEMQSIGKKMMLAGGAGLASLALASSAASDYGKAIAEVSTIAGSAEFPLERIKAITAEMSTLYEGDLTSQAKALYQAISAGATSAADATSLMHASNKLAIAGVSTTEEAIDGLTSVINAYGKSFAEAGEVSDAFFTAVRLGKTTIPELSRFIGNVAPTASAVGVSVDELSAAIAGLTASGVRSRIAMTALKAMMSNVLKPSAEAEKLSKKLGIEFNASALEAKGLAGFLRDVKNAVGEDKTAMATLFGSVEAFNAIMVLTGKGSGKFNEALDAMKTKSGAANKAYGTMANTTSFLSEVLKSNLMVALVQIGEALEPFKRPVLRGLTTLVSAFTSLPPSVKSVLAGMIALVSVLLVVGGFTLFLTGAAMLLALAWEAVAIVAVATIVVMEWLSAAIAVAGTIATGFWLALQKDVGGFASYLRDVYAKARVAWDALVQLFSTGTLSGAVMVELNKAENKGLKDFVVQLWGWGVRVVEFFKSIGSGFSDAVGGMGDTFNDLKSAIMGLLSAFGLVKDSPEEAASSFKTAQRWGRAFGKTLASVFRIAVVVITAATEILSGFIGTMHDSDTTTSLLGAALDQLVAAFDQLGTSLGFVDVAGDNNKTMWEKLGAAIAYVVLVVASAVSVFAWFVGMVATAFAGVLGIITGVWTGFASIVGGVADLIFGVLAGDWVQAWNGAKSVVLGVVQVIASALMGIVGIIAGIVDAVASITTGKELNLRATVNTAREGLLGAASKAFGPNTSYEAAPTGLVQNATPASLPTSPRTSPEASTAATSAAGNAAGTDRIVSAIANQKPPQLNASLSAELIVDGQKMAETVKKYDTDNGNRGFGPTPEPA